MHALVRLVLASLALFVAACDMVSSPTPLGEKSHAIKAQEWDGRWFDSNGYVDLSVVDGANGLMKMTVVDQGESDTLDLQLREGFGWVFANAREAEYFDSQGLEIEGAGYLWARIVKDENVIRAWRPDPEVFARLVTEGLIPGHVEDGDVVLGALTNQHYNAIVSGSHGIVLEWEDPIVLYRYQSGKAPE